MPSSGFFVSSIPKSGTHLLSSLIEIHTGIHCISVKSGTVNFPRYARYPNLIGHWRSSQVRKNENLYSLIARRKLLIMIRDPRDICNSMLPYVMGSGNSKHQLVAQKLHGLPYEEQISLIARGFDTDHESYSMPSIRRSCDGFHRLKTKLFPDAELIRYEDFFEPDRIVPILCRALSVNEERARELASQALGSGSKTKRKDGARPYQWRERFSPELRDTFAREYADLLQEMGYEL